MACRFFCLLRQMTAGKESVPHVHWDKVSGNWNNYKEVKGLVPGSAVRPDGYVADASGATKGTVYLFHGNHYHGYPPDHPQYSGTQTFVSKRNGTRRTFLNSELYEKTEKTTQAYLDAGYAVVEMWEHDFKEAEKHNGLLLSLVRRR